MEKSIVIGAGHFSCRISAQGERGIVLVENKQEESTIEDFKENFIISRVPDLEYPSGAYKSGRELRKERRKLERKNKKFNK
jgi:hypothetical protein